MRHKNYFYCSHCNRQVPFKSLDAKVYESNLYCSEECILESLYIEDYPWDEEFEYNYVSEESNGYGVTYINKDWYSNKIYIIFRSIDFSLDKDEEDYFGTTRNTEELNSKVNSYLENFKSNQLKILSKDIIHQKGTYVSIDDYRFDNNLFSFVLNKLDYKSNSEVKYFIYNETLYLACNDYKAMLANYQGQ